jgi:hypothetical protein
LPDRDQDGCPLDQFAHRLEHAGVRSSPKSPSATRGGTRSPSNSRYVQPRPPHSPDTQPLLTPPTGPLPRRPRLTDSALARDRKDLHRTSRGSPQSHANSATRPTNQLVVPTFTTAPIAGAALSARGPRPARARVISRTVTPLPHPSTASCSERRDLSCQLSGIRSSASSMAARMSVECRSD